MSKVKVSARLGDLSISIRDDEFDGFLVGQLLRKLDAGPPSEIIAEIISWFYDERDDRPSPERWPGHDQLTEELRLTASRLQSGWRAHWDGVKDRTRPTVVDAGP
jgi:hypothetical protein